jgi:hypothetical protein
MPQIHIANIDNENMVADRSAIDFSFRSVSAMCARRMAWFAEPGDIVVLPNDLSDEMKGYIGCWMGVPPESVSYVFPDFPKEEMRPLGAAELSHPSLLQRLKDAKSGRTDWKLRPYYHDRTIRRLARDLSIEECRGDRFQPFLRDGGAEILNDKGTFRNLAAGRGISLAAGEVCKSADELAGAVAGLIRETGAVIIKQNRHSGAEGNIIVSLSEDVGTQGALRLVFLDSSNSIPEEVEKLWRDLAYDGQGTVVVESYYPVQAILYAEYDVDPALNCVRFLNWGEQRMEPIFMGFVIPPDIPAFAAAEFVAGATELARITCDLGFAGLMDVDGIVTADGHVIFNEINARSGGCSHIHRIASKLLGRDYGDRSVIVSHNRVTVSNPHAVRSLLRGASGEFGFDRETRTGIVITSEDLAISGMVEFMAIAPTKEEAVIIEQSFEAAITRPPPRADERPADSSEFNIPRIPAA